MSLSKRAFLTTLPVLTGYLVLGLGFGLLLDAAGYGILWSLAMSVFIYAGSMQYLAVSLLSSGASLLTFAVTTLMVNARHLFYGISMVDRYRDAGPCKPYLIFALTDETYSLVSSDLPIGVPPESATKYRLLVSLFDQSYWIAGCTLGSLCGNLIHINTAGLDFALTALFITIFTDQWLKSKDHIPALIGIGASVVARLIFGASDFLIPAMILIAASLLLLRKTRKEEPEKEVKDNE